MYINYSKGIYWKELRMLKVVYSKWIWNIKYSSFEKCRIAFETWSHSQILTNAGTTENEKIQLDSTRFRYTPRDSAKCRKIQIYAGQFKQWMQATINAVSKDISIESSPSQWTKMLSIAKHWMLADQSCTVILLQFSMLNPSWTFADHIDYTT